MSDVEKKESPLSPEAEFRSVLRQLDIAREALTYAILETKSDFFLAQRLARAFAEVDEARRDVNARAG